MVENLKFHFINEFFLLNKIMGIDLGNFPIGTPPSEDDKNNILTALGGYRRPEVQFTTPVNDDTITISNNKDSSVYLSCASSLSSLNILFPSSPHDGQFIIINLPISDSLNVSANMYWGGDILGSYDVNILYGGQTYTFQYVSSQNNWYSL